MGLLSFVFVNCCIVALIHVLSGAPGEATVEETPRTETGEAKIKAVVEECLKWSDDIVPYRISNRFRKYERRLIKKAMKYIEDRTCISFEERTDETDYAYFVKRNKCSSTVGRSRRPGRQEIALANQCLTFNNILYEVARTLGYSHERRQRNEVEGHLQPNISKGVEESLDQPYNSTSVTQSNNLFKGNETSKTLVFLMFVDQKKGFSSSVAIRQINGLYGCPEESVSRGERETSTDGQQLVGEPSLGGRIISKIFNTLFSKIIDGIFKPKSNS